MGNEGKDKKSGGAGTAPAEAAPTVAASGTTYAIPEGTMAKVKALWPDAKERGKIIESLMSGKVIHRGAHKLKAVIKPPVKDDGDMDGSDK
jgi:microcompartment protein CcmL/EutN